MQAYKNFMIFSMLPEFLNFLFVFREKCKILPFIIYILLTNAINFKKLFLTLI